MSQAQIKAAEKVLAAEAKIRWAKHVAKFAK